MVRRLVLQQPWLVPENQEARILDYPAPFPPHPTPSTGFPELQVQPSPEVVSSPDCVL